MKPAMMDVLLDKHFGGASWRSRLGGASVVSVANGILTTTSTENTQAAFKDFYVPIRPGMRVESSVYARKLSGDAVGSGLYVDLVGFDGNGSFVVDESEFKGNDWKKYAVGYTVPDNVGNDNKFVRIAHGIRTANLGDARMRHPIIRVSRGYGAPMIIARALIRVIGGVVDLHAGFPSHGIASVAFNGTDTVTVTLEHQVMTFVDLRPLVQVSGTTDQAAQPCAGSVTGGAAPTFLVKWSSGAAFANVSAGNWFAFIEVTY